MAAMKRTYKNPKKAESVFYASRNSGRISGVDKARAKRATKR